jgi:hypothetical protein
MKGIGWKGVNSSPFFGPDKGCEHPKVHADPILGGFSCVKCHEHFEVVPDVVMKLPRALGFWQRLWWAIRTARKVPVVPFEWSHAWAKLRQDSPVMRQWTHRLEPEKIHMPCPDRHEWPDGPPIYKRPKQPVDAPWADAEYGPQNQEPS